MNIQIFGTRKNFDSKKAERYFKERGIRVQFVDMKDRDCRRGNSIRSARLWAAIRS